MIRKSAFGWVMRVKLALGTWLLSVLEREGLTVVESATLDKLRAENKRLRKRAGPDRRRAA